MGRKIRPMSFSGSLAPLTARADLEDEVEQEADLSNAFLSWGKCIVYLFQNLFVSVLSLFGIDVLDYRFISESPDKLISP
ncbi:hypothetical protein BHE74_00037206 [Ensete ventricosum]|uniref:Uncharacterized protein n=1 Tax=Ensete ventricosum TaxID=4639 RepID=A0A427AHH5_ENSVE|nr:hypothetical protein B296_00005231 [Ensete ventricosum]RWW09573.1 hypothetical protein GW17_00026934 [Ensete ventricosum]RWW56110.1 hypothetical protein BHE74_00037206 [Ensete ventricosum]RZS17113.1 hypothetical protein BHM03_00049242 [Ensete ventricosum]